MRVAWQAAKRASNGHHGIGKLPHEFSDSFKASIHTMYPVNNAEVCPYFGHPADDFVNAILSEVRFATDELDALSRRLVKQDLIAERDAVRSTLTSAHDKLRTLSPDFDALLGVDAAPLGLADRLDAFLRRIDTVVIEEFAPVPNAKDVRSNIAHELAIRVLRVAKEYGMEKISATADAVFGYTSDAVRLLVIIGNEIGINYVSGTWKNIIADILKEDPDLKSQ